MKYAVWAALLSGGLAYSCSGTETQNPVNPRVEWKGSECKKEAGKTTGGGLATATQALVSTSYGTETRGLQCFAWEVVGKDHVKIDLYNFEGACGAAWSGTAAIVAGELQLNLVNPECLIAKCGTCMYDWSFDLQGIDLTDAIPVTVGVDTCPGQQEVRRVNTTLPVAERSSGILCKYASFSGLGWQALALEECGTEAMPCNGTSMCQGSSSNGAVTCQGNLSCVDNGNPDQRICAKTCISNEDCGTTGVLSCQEGLCRPANPW